MQQFPYNSYGDTSDEVTTIVRSIKRNDVTNPLAVVRSALDWSLYYATDGEALDGSATEAFPDGRPGLFYSQWAGEPKRYLNIFIDGAPTFAKNVPFRFSAAAHGAATLTRCVPRLPATPSGIVTGALTECSIVCVWPDGSQPVVFRYQQAIS